MGTWFVHDAILTIAANGSGTQTFSSAASAEIDSLTLADQATTRLIGTIRSIRYMSHGHQVPDPDPQDTQAPGDTFTLTWVDGHLLKKAYLKSSLPPAEIADSNPYWCGGGPGSIEDVIARTPSSDRTNCGA